MVRNLVDRDELVDRDKFMDRDIAISSVDTYSIIVTEYEIF